MYACVFVFVLAFAFAFVFVFAFVSVFVSVWYRLTNIRSELSTPKALVVMAVRQDRHRVFAYLGVPTGRVARIARELEQILKDVHPYEYR